MVEECGILFHISKQFPTINLRKVRKDSLDKLRIKSECEERFRQLSQVQFQNVGNDVGILIC